ncbi:16S rRNA (guanine(527)-N(7))-methyltransferase RsmG [Parvularcula sp. IMCC14364]|uniref:16S rRNA (guanine(527)-N(7))-methyltransferase RsmG n=1 Tax=Parvularcula sp. IMCC14364 TaxID=3067902 RepID=UPI002740E0FA|nr:16S rRNA (guanine(527)-N(7))-methyltransferase RsmG [Parvularcula sp. IMCC14364]
MGDAAFDSSEFLATCNISRETREMIEIFDSMFVAWTGRLNLVAKSTISDRWSRHYLDSAQLLPLMPGDAKVVMDFGSGAGFPGLFLAILCAHDHTRSHQHYYLVESISKKCAFLREVVAALGLTNVTILNQRIEDIKKPAKADIITARALAGLDRLLDYSARFMHKRSICLFLKGEKAQEEIEAAQVNWLMDVSSHKSQTHEAAAILEIRNLSRA